MSKALTFEEVLGSSGTLYVGPERKPVQFYYTIDADGNERHESDEDEDMGPAVIIVLNDQAYNKYYVKSPEIDNEEATELVGDVTFMDVYKTATGGRKHRKSRITRKKRKATRRTRKH